MLGTRAEWDRANGGLLKSWGLFTAAAAVVALLIACEKPGPRGDPGPPGPLGEQGPQGADGRAGAGFRAAYDFDEGAGGTSIDGTGGGHDLALNSSGVAWTGLGHTGAALNFDGAAGHAVAASAPGLNPVEEITIQAWVHQTGGAGATNTIVAKEGQYALAIANGQLKFAVQTLNGPPSEYVGGGTVPLDVWTHVQATYDGLSIRTYVDGAMTSLVTYPHGRIAATTNPLRLGLRQDGSDGFTGRIDEVRILGLARQQDSFLRRIGRWQGYLNDNTDNGVLGGRTVTVLKRAASTGLRVVWSDNFRVFTTNGACRWHVLFNGAVCADPGTLMFDKYEGGTASNRHDPATVVGTCFGLAAGQVVVTTRVGTSNGDCYTGWTNQLVSLEVEEVL